MRIAIRLMMDVRQGDTLVFARQIAEVLHDLLHRAVQCANKHKACTGQHGSEKRATMLCVTDEVHNGVLAAYT